MQADRLREQASDLERSGELGLAVEKYFLAAGTLLFARGRGSTKLHSFGHRRISPRDRSVQGRSDREAVEDALYRHEAGGPRGQEAHGPGARSATVATTTATTTSTTTATTATTTTATTTTTTDIVVTAGPRVPAAVAAGSTAAFARLAVLARLTLLRAPADDPGLAGPFVRRRPRIPPTTTRTRAPRLAGSRHPSAELDGRRSGAGEQRRGRGSGMVRGARVDAPAIRHPDAKRYLFQIKCDRFHCCAHGEM